MKESVSLKDIARICHVSVSTVSKALNDRADVGRKNKEEIRRVAKELNYVPNYMASTLRSKKTRNIGVLLSEGTGTNLMHEHFARILNSFKDTVEERGYFISFLNANYSPNHMTLMEQCRYMNFDGVFVLCADFTREETNQLLEAEMPIVVIDHSMSKHVNIAANNQGDMRRLLQLIYYRGHRRIAYIHGQNNEVTHSRVNAYKAFLKEQELPMPSEYLYTCNYRDYERASAMTKAVLALPNRPTCIIYPDDLTAVGGLNMMQEAGLVIPRDVSIAGYDGLNFANIVRPRITTIKQDTVSMGIQAGNKLVNRIEFPEENIHAETVIVDGMVEPGETVAVISDKYMLSR